MDVLTKAGGEKSGIPYFFVTDAKGKMLMTSKRKVEGTDGQNVGHPVRPEEVAHFMQVLIKTAPRMTKEQLASIEKHLSSQEIG